jgi:hypothetical protein
MRRGRGLILALVVLGAVPVACRREHATAPVCGVVLDRIVELELAEQGFRDPALATQKKRELRTLLGPQLRSCVGRKMRHDALDCVAQARSTEEISHVCLH